MKKALFCLLMGCCAALAAQPMDSSSKGSSQLEDAYWEAKRHQAMGEDDLARNAYLKAAQIDPTNPVVAYELAKFHADNMEIADAFRYMGIALSADPNNKWYLILQAGLLRYSGRFDEEIVIRKKLVELEPRDPDRLMDLADAYSAKNEPELALSAYQAIEVMMGGPIDVVTERKVQIYLQRGSVKEAVECLEAQYEQDGNAEILGRIGQIYAANGQEKKALKLFQDMLKSHPDDARIHLELARIHQERGDFDEAMVHPKAAAGNPNLPFEVKAALLGGFYNNMGKNEAFDEEAVVLAHTVAEAHPENGLAQGIYGDFLLKVNDFNGALLAYRTARRLNVEDPTLLYERLLALEEAFGSTDSLYIFGKEAVERAPNKALYYYYAGSAAMQLEKYDDAIVYLSDGLDLAGRNKDLRYNLEENLARTYHYAKRYKESDAAYENLLKANPEDALVLNNYAFFLSERGENLDKALRMSEKSNELKPNNASYLDTWAWILYKQKNYPEALKRMEEALVLIGRDSPEYESHYADILEAVGEKEKADAVRKRIQEMQDLP